MPVNTATLKTFAQAMRRQLIEAVGRKLDRLLTSQTPDTLTTYARQIADLRQQEQASRQGLLERVAYSWPLRLSSRSTNGAQGLPGRALRAGGTELTGPTAAHPENEYSP
jgi:hypothetical protein